MTFDQTKPAKEPSYRLYEIRLPRKEIKVTEYTSKSFAFSNALHVPLS